MATIPMPTDLAHLPPFVNESFLDFTRPDIKRSYLAALDEVASELGREYDLILGGKRVRTADKITSVNPANPSEIIGIHQRAEAEHAEPAIQAALAAFPAWSRTPVQERVALLLRVSELISRRKFTLCAWLTYEVGKNWAEADADVAECIDFLQFYAREALKLDAATTPIPFPGERNQLRYIPLGVGAVIPPWNFPFAIMAGMTAAAIVTGNTVILKPSPDAPTIAAKFYELLEEAGLALTAWSTSAPAKVQASARPSSHTLKHASSRLPARRRLGLRFTSLPRRPSPARSSSSAPSLRWAVRTPSSSIAMPICVSAVDGVVASAFGFNGQKCSACSRAIVDTEIYDSFIDLLKDKVAGHPEQGPPTDNFYAGPVDQSRSP